MIVLGIETSTLTGGVALLKDRDLIGEITLSVSVRHSERLMPAIDQLLQGAGVSLAQIDLFAVAHGPGSFTGLRIGIAAAQGLAAASQKPLIGISTLEALAFQGLFFDGLVVPLLDAYRGEVYRGIYSVQSNSLLPVSEEKVTAIPALVEELSSHPQNFLFLGNGAELYRDQIGSSLREKAFFAPAFLKDPRASHVAWIASQKWIKNQESTTVLPLYLRKAG